MNKTIKAVFALALLLLGNVAVCAETLAKFDLNDFLGWTYTRADFKLSTDAIGANKVRLFKASNGENYTLVSPEFAVDGVTTVAVDATLLAPTSSNKSYDLTKGSPTFELVDGNGNVVAKKFYQYTSAEIQRDVHVEIDVPADAKTLQLRVAAWNADYNSPVAVRNVAVAKAESGVEMTPSDGVSLTTGPGKLLVGNAAGSLVVVYDLGGRVVKKMMAAASTESIALAPGVYAVSVAGKVTKIIINN